MILALERSSFNYLYKYNQIKVNPNALTEISPANEKSSMRVEDIVRQLERALPTFEEDHEVLLLDIDRNFIEYSGFLTISYAGIKNVYPLTSTGAQLLEGRLNQNIPLSRPIFEDAVYQIKHKRSLNNRLLATKKLHIAFSLKPGIKTPDFQAIQDAVSAILNERKTSSYKFIYELLSYNLTPAYVPEGYLEHLVKIAMLAIRAMNRDEEAIKHGPYYKRSIAELGGKKLTLAETYEQFWSIKDSEFLDKAKSVAEQASQEHKGVDVFKIAYYYLAFKKILQKNDAGLLKIAPEIAKLRWSDEFAASWVLTLLGFSFSFENLYESLHQLEANPFPATAAAASPKPLKMQKKPAEIAYGTTVDLDPGPQSTKGEQEVVIGTQKAPEFSAHTEKIAESGEEQKNSTPEHSLNQVQQEGQKPVQQIDAFPAPGLWVDDKLRSSAVKVDQVQITSVDGIDAESPEFSSQESEAELDITDFLVEIERSMSTKKKAKANVIANLSEQFGTKGKIKASEYDNFLQQLRTIADKKTYEGFRHLFGI